MSHEAHRWGFVNEILPADRLMERAWELARLLESGPPLVYAAIKEIVREAEGTTFQTDDEQDHQTAVCDGRYPLFERGPVGRRTGIRGEAKPQSGKESEKAAATASSSRMIAGNRASGGEETASRSHAREVLSTHHRRRNRGMNDYTKYLASRVTSGGLSRREFMGRAMAAGIDTCRRRQAFHRKRHGGRNRSAAAI